MNPGSRLVEACWWHFSRFTTEVDMRGGDKNHDPVDLGAVVLASAEGPDEAP
jgi:hypothetical protein